MTGWGTQPAPWGEERGGKKKYEDRADQLVRREDVEKKESIRKDNGRKDKQKTVTQLEQRGNTQVSQKGEKACFTAWKTVKRDHSMETQTPLYEGPQTWGVEKKKNRKGTGE